MTGAAVRAVTYRESLPCVRVGSRLRFRPSELVSPCRSILAVYPAVQLSPGGELIPRAYCGQHSERYIYLSLKMYFP
jgi:hypothetical protein